MSETYRTQIEAELSQVSKDETLQTLVSETSRLADAAEMQALATAAMSPGEIKDWHTIQNAVRTGVIKKVLTTGDQLRVAKESGVYATIATTGVTAADVVEETFISAVGHAESAAYEFEFDGAAWHLDGKAVELGVYGITVTGTPVEGDRVTIHVQGSYIIMEVADTIGHDAPANPERKNALPLITRDVQHYDAIAPNPAQALISIRAEDWPDGLPAGTYSITLNHGAYTGTTVEDAVYSFTTTQTVPPGGKIRHSAMGAYQSDAANYSTARVAAGTFTTYGADYEVIEQGLATTINGGGTSLGVATAYDPQYRTSSNVNFTMRNFYGSSRASHSNQLKHFNSDAPAAASGAIASWWYPSDEFDMPVKSTLPGWLHGIDPSFLAVCGKTIRRRAKSIADGYGYEDLELFAWIPSMTEMGLGKNNQIAETTVDVEGNTASEEGYALYKNAEQADRIKTHNGNARYYFLGSVLPGSAHNVRYINPSGALSSYSANYRHGGVAGLDII